MRSGDSGWDRFAQGYGPEWVHTKQRFRAAWWTRKRCFWCRRVKHVNIEIHHLTYLFGQATPPLAFLRPMCARCHDIETRVCRYWFSTRQRHRWAHAWVTYAGRWFIRSPLVFAVAYVALLIGV